MDVKEKILSRATEEFLKNGIKCMSVQKLVVPLGISTKTFYKYFKNKEELLEEVLTLLYIQQFKRIEEDSNTENPIHLLLQIWSMAFQRENDVNHKFYYDLHQYYPEVESRVENRVGQDFWKEFRHLINIGIENDLFLKTTQPDVVLEAISVLYSVSVRTEQFEKFGLSPTIIFQNTLAVLIRGICTSKGLDDFEKYNQPIFENN
ncbi:helix-turn-helix domain-containing protein [uncultured Draconibacterium sp.]|uniref:TetR/AcrR family transcriptional regulator n=1 Tax=uncultured Draconibacterium sp. TaxID=1573823 RepID=UPI0029C95432|nr:helix-turn-helix domain-containing protein [uncultured Draconibacterium sp.]